MAASIPIWADTMFGFSIALMALLPTIFWYHRNHPLIAVRLPIVCVAELLLDLLLLAIVSSLSGSVYSGWLPCPCWFQNALNAAFGAIIWHVTMARIVILYRLAQSNSGEQYNPDLLFNRIIHWLGRLNAPTEFIRLELRLAKSHNSTTGNSELTTSLTGGSSSRTSYTESHSGLSEKKKEYLNWSLKLLGWFVWWCVLSFITTIGTDGTLLYQPMETAFPACSVTIFYQIGAHLIFWNVMQLTIVFVCYRSLPDDSLGLKTELAVMQTVFSIFWITDGILMVSSPTNYFTFGTWTDLSAMIMHALVTFGYPIALVYYRKWQEIQLIKGGQSTVKTEADFEKIWLNNAGRSKIITIAKNNFAIENTNFLALTDNLADITPKKFVSLYQNYIDVASPYELNLLAKDRKAISESIKKKEYRVELIAEARKHIMGMMFLNFKQDLAYEFRSSKSTTAAEEFKEQTKVAVVKTKEVEAPAKVEPVKTEIAKPVEEPKVIAPVESVEVTVEVPAQEPETPSAPVDTDADNLV